MSSLDFTSNHFSILDEPTVMEIDVQFSSLTRKYYEFEFFIFDTDVKRYRSIEEFPAIEQIAIRGLAGKWAADNALETYEQSELSAGDREYEAWLDRQMEERL